MERIEFHLPRLPLRPLKLSGKLRQLTALCLRILDQLEKKLCEGTYTRIKVREQFVLLFLKEINGRCSNMCSKKNPSMLYKTSQEDIVNFSLTELHNELKDKQIVLHLVNIHCIAVWTHIRILIPSTLKQMKS